MLAPQQGWGKFSLPTLLSPDDSRRRAERPWCEYGLYLIFLIQCRNDATMSADGRQRGHILLVPSVSCAVIVHCMASENTLPALLPCYCANSWMQPLIPGVTTPVILNLSQLSNAGPKVGHNIFIHFTIVHCAVKVTEVPSAPFTVGPYCDLTALLLAIDNVLSGYCIVSLYLFMCVFCILRRPVLHNTHSLLRPYF